MFVVSQFQKLWIRSRAGFSGFVNFQASGFAQNLDFQSFLTSEVLDGRTSKWGPAFCSVSTRSIREDHLSVPREKMDILKC